MKIHWNRKTNKILEDNGDFLTVDISTPRYPDATMACDTDVFEAHTGGRIHATTSAGHKYIYASYDRIGEKKTCLFHRDVLPALPPLEVDHIKHGTMSFIDNRKSNLRAVTRSQNHQNQSKRRNNTSGIKGVDWHKAAQKWQARVMVGGKAKHLGLFANKADAITTRKAAERKYFGEYAFKGE